MSVKKTFRRRDVVFLAFLFTIVHGILVFHEEKKSWWEAQSTCSQDGGTLVTTYTSADILRLTSAIETVWEGRYYSSWAWLIGCYSYNGSYDYIELKRNQLKKCLNHCNTTNYFGLQNKKCFCFDTFNGEFKRTEDNCIHECPGNSEERCGGPQALTVYMNDICYDNSREWQGTVSRTFTGKRCLPWANVTAMQTSSTIADYPDGPAENASNFCRDPTNKSFLWCYVSQDEIEQCDIPKCIAEDSVYPCMSFRKSGGIFYFTQENCDKTNAAVCETSGAFYTPTKRWLFHILVLCLNESHRHFRCRALDENKAEKNHKHLLDRNIRTWSDARDQNRHAYYRDSGVSYYCFMLAGPGIFRLKTNLQDFWTWFAYSRNICSVSTIVPSREPRQCFGMFYYDGYIRSTIKSCDEQKSFVCQYEKVTCGEKFNMSLNGSLVTPGYMGRGYDHYGRCVWTISVPKDHNIQLSMNISIENTYMCRSDFLRVFRGNFSNGISLCGNVTDVLNIASSNVTIEFRSDGTINGKGVYITWEAVPLVSEVTNSITREISTILTPSSTTFDILITKDSNGHENRFLLAGIPGETLIGILVGVLAVCGGIFGMLFVCRRRRNAIDKNKRYDGIVQSSDHDEITEHPFVRDLNPNTSSGSETMTGQSSQELYHNAFFGNETSITESSSNIYHNQSVDEKESWADNASNIYDNTSFKGNQWTVEEMGCDYLGDNYPVDRVSQIDDESTPTSNLVQEKSSSSEKIHNISTDIYNTLNEAVRNEYQNQPETVYTNHRKSDDIYDQIKTSRRQSEGNSIDLSETNMYDQFTNYQVEYSKASACGRQNVEDSMALTDKLTYDFLTKSE